MHNQQEIKLPYCDICGAGAEPKDGVRGDPITKRDGYGRQFPGWFYHCKQCDIPDQLLQYLIILPDRKIEAPRGIQRQLEELKIPIDNLIFTEP